MRLGEIWRNALVPFARRALASWGNMPILDPSTIALTKLCVNIVVRAIVVAAAFAILLAISILLNLLINYVLNVVNASDAVRGWLSLLAVVVPVMIAVGIGLTSIGDVWNLTKSSLKTPDNTTHMDAENED